MRFISLFSLLAIASILGGIPRTSGAESSRKLERLAELRFVHPEVMAARINGLFDGAKVAHPAAALSAWKRATDGKGSLGRPLEAAIAMFNPEMAREWRSFHGAILTFWSTSENPTTATGIRGLDWSMTIPNDDGSVSAFLTAGRLTGGRREDAPSGPLDAPVDRLGPPGAPFSARIGHTQVIAGSLESLRMATAEIEGKPKVEKSVAKLPVEREEDLADSDASGIRFTMNANLFNVMVSGTNWSRPIGELVRTAEGRKVEGFASLEDDELRIRLKTAGGNPGSLAFLDAGPVEPGWLDWIPRSRALAAVVLRVESTPKTWDLLFNLIDRIEKADPTRAGAAPFRMRFNLLLAAARVRPEIDLWPHLRGVTASVVGDPRRGGAVSGGLLALHLDEESAAKSIRDVLAPRIADTYLRGSDRIAARSATAPSAPQPVEEIPRLGSVGNRSLQIARRGRTVLLGWGAEEEFAACLVSRTEPAANLAVMPIVGAADLASPRIGLVWPGRFDVRFAGNDPDSPTRRLLADTAPVVWVGGRDAEMNQLDDRIVRRDLRTFVKCYLETLPLDRPDRP